MRTFGTLCFLALIFCAGYLLGRHPDLVKNRIIHTARSINAAIP